MFYAIHDIDKAIAWIEPALAALEAKGGEPASNVISMLYKEEAQLLRSDDGSWVVAYITENNTFWVLSAVGNWHNNIDSLEQVARDNGCKALAFNTIRKGFARTLKKTAYKAVSTEYRKELNV